MSFGNDFSIYTEVLWRAVREMNKKRKAPAGAEVIDKVPATERTGRS